MLPGTVSPTAIGIPNRAALASGQQIAAVVDLLSTADTHSIAPATDQLPISFGWHNCAPETLRVAGSSFGYCPARGPFRKRPCNINTKRIKILRPVGRICIDDRSQSAARRQRLSTPRSLVATGLPFIVLSWLFWLRHRFLRSKSARSTSLSVTARALVRNGRDQLRWTRPSRSRSRTGAPCSCRGSAIFWAVADNSASGWTGHSIIIVEKKMHELFQLHRNARGSGALQPVNVQATQLHRAASPAALHGA